MTVDMFVPPTLPNGDDVKVGDGNWQQDAATEASDRGR